MNEPNLPLTIGGWIGTLLLGLTLIWLLANGRIRALAGLTVLDSIRRMEFQALLLFGAVLLGGMGSILFSQEAMKLPMWRLVVDKIGGDVLGAPGVQGAASQQWEAQFLPLMQSAMAFFAELFIFFMILALGLFLYQNDRQQGFLLTLLPKPVSRGEYLWGRALGLLATVSAAWVLFGCEMFLIYLLYDSASPQWKILHTTGILLMKWATLIAILTLLTLRLPVIIGGFCTLLLFVAGHVAVLLHDVGTDEAIAWPIRLGAWAVYVILPHYDQAWSANILDPLINPFQHLHDVARFFGWGWTYLMVCGLLAWHRFRAQDV